MKDYWNSRFQDEGLIWGDKPSITAQYATDLFLKNHVKTVLVPGAGYGRNTKLLSNTFEVDAIELSPKAVLIARQLDYQTKFIEGYTILKIQNNRNWVNT